MIWALQQAGELIVGVVVIGIAAFIVGAVIEWAEGRR